MTKRRKYPQDFLDRLKSVKGRRSITVIKHILKYGSITTEEFEKQYGYSHPPRAVRDVREQGIPLETFSVKNSEGRTIAAYRFGDPTLIQSGKLGGRKVFAKAFKQKLIAENGSRCAICLQTYAERYLQVDHRVPYEVAGDIGLAERNTKDYMLLCGSCNRAKSWSCEHCVNWLEIKNPELCLTCYWASPESHQHIALRNVRRIDVVWTEREVEQYEQLKRRVAMMNEPMPDYVKAVLKKHLDENG